MLLSGCGSEVVQPYSHIAPTNGKTEDIQTLYKIIFWAALIVFIGVQAAILYTALRFRRRNEERPEQVHGSRKLEIAWTIIPAVILLVLFIPNAQVIFKHAAAETGTGQVRRRCHWQAVVVGVPLPRYPGGSE